MSAARTSIRWEGEERLPNSLRLSSRCFRRWAPKRCCFKSNGAKLSKACVDALIAAGDTPQEYVDQQKKLLGR
jgi:hypothetical protein